MDIFPFEGGDSPRNDEPPDYDRRGYEYTPRTCLATLYDDAFLKFNKTSLMLTRTDRHANRGQSHFQLD